MKRSTKIGLGAAGIVLAASVWSLMGGEDEKIVYSDAAACRADGKLTAEQCEQRFQEARAAHARDARRFPSLTGCEAEFGSGRCESILVNGAQMWVPAFAGLMLARGLAGAAQQLLPPNRQMCPPGSTVPECQPARSGGGSGGGGHWYTTTSGGSVSTSPSGRSGVSVASRGGFGSTGHGVSSGS